MLKLSKLASRLFSENKQKDVIMELIENKENRISCYTSFLLKDVLLKPDKDNKISKDRLEKYEKTSKKRMEFVCIPQNYKSGKKTFKEEQLCRWYKINYNTIIEAALKYAEAAEDNNKQ